MKDVYPKLSASDVAHYDGLTYWGPISEGRMESVLELVNLAPGDAVLDVGCGRAEVLLRLVERFQVSAHGVDRSKAAIAQAQSEVARRVPKSEVSFSVCDVSEFAPGAESYDFISWLGGPYLGNGFLETVRKLSSWLRPGGGLLVGHGFWQRAPATEYLVETGIAKEEFAPHYENLRVGQSTGLTLGYTCVSNRDEWDAFEGRILHNWERRLVSEPENRELIPTVERKRKWNNAQQRWGRDAMGFGLYLFRKNAS